MTLLANLIGYQLVWLLVVWSAGASRPIVGIGAAATFVVAQLVASRTRRSDVLLVLVALIGGVIVDGLLARTGWVRYAANDGVLVAPTWILALWAAFAMTLNHSLHWLLGRPGVAALFGGIGGPLAYLAASRGFGAVSLEPPLWLSIGSVGAGWALALACLARWGHRSRAPVPERTAI